MYIFIDESGDLGFKETSSKWFVFGIIITKNQRSLEKIVYKVWKNLKKKHKKLGELHAYHSTDSTRIKMLQNISKNSDIKIIYGIIEKSTILNKYRKNKDTLYTNILYLTLENLIKSNNFNANENICVYIDRKDVNIKSVNELSDNLSTLFRNSGLNNYSITIESSNRNKSLQLVDFISWALFRKLERNDLDFYNIIKNNVVIIYNISL